MAFVRNCTAAFAAVSLLASTAAAAAPRTVDPLVALSVFGTSESRAAVCAAGAAQAAAAAGAAAAQAAAGPGCVLPVMDAVAPPVVSETAPPMAVAPAAVGGGVGALPLLLGLAAVAVLAAIVLKHSDEDDGEINLPISP